MLPDHHTPKTLSFTFRVNAILSVRLHSTRTNPLAASLPPTFQYTEWNNHDGDASDTLICCYGKSPYQNKYYFAGWIEKTKSQRVETCKLELFFFLFFFSMNFKMELKESIYFTLVTLKRFHIKNPSHMRSQRLFEDTLLHRDWL